MPLFNSRAALQLGDAYFFHAPTGTPKPSIATMDTFDDFEADGWISYGLTPLDSLATITREGGETETVGFWQLPSYFSKISPVVESLDFALSEWTTEALKRYLGSNASVDSDGDVAGSTNPVGTREAFLLVIRAQDGFVGIYIDEAEVLGRDNIELSERGNTTGFPVRATAKSASGYGFRFLRHRAAA